MPHKRAKRTVREQERSLKGTDLPPKHSGNEATIPQSVARILNAEKIRKEFREKKRMIDESDGDRCPQQKRRRQTRDGVEDRNGESLKIQHRETIAHFNKRVESSMMPLIRTAMQQSSSQVRRSHKHETGKGVTKLAQGKTAINHVSRANVSNPSPASTHTPQQQSCDKPKEFCIASTSAPRRLNDIAQEPPQFTKLPRGAKTGKDSSQPNMTGILSMAQKVMIEEERENVIKRYRELKARRLRNDDSAVGG